jgi:hypothetical protein
MPTGGKGSSGGGGGKAGSGDIRAGGAFVELFARDNLTKVLDKLKSRVAAAGKTFQEAGKKGALAGAAILAPITALFVGGVNRVADTARMARQFQIPIELMGRLQYAAEAAGVSVQDVMNDTQGRFRDLLAKAPVVDPGRAQQALKTQEAFRDATRALQDALLPLLDIVTPIVQAFSEFIQRNAQAVTVIAAVGAGLLAAGTAGTVFGTAITIATTAATALGAVVSAIVTPIGLVAAGVAGLGYLFATQTETGRKFTSSIATGFAGAAETAKAAWAGIAEAIRAGDLGKAVQISLAGLNVEFSKATLLWTKQWNWFKSGFVDGWRDAVTIVSKLLVDLGAVIARNTIGILADSLSRLAELADVADRVGAGALARKLRAGASLFPGDAEINRGRDALKAQIDADRAAAQKGVDAARAASMAVAQGELDKAIMALRNLLAVPALGAGAKQADPMRGDQLFRRAAAASFEAVRGGFGAGLGRQQFGLGDQVKVQTELQKQIKDNTALTAANVAAILVALRLN